MVKKASVQRKRASPVRRDVASKAEAPPEWSPVDAVLRLQRAMGNHSVSRLLARLSSGAGVARLALGGLSVSRDVTTADAPAVPATGPLTAPQVQDAIAWYKARPGRYTAEIITRIQAQVGVDATGTIDAATVQAVAKYQQANPPLWIDGKAGPRTLPAAFPVGLATKGSIKTYVKKAKEVQAGWAKLKTAAERAKALMEAVNAELAAANVPPCKFVVKDLGNDAGQLDFATWTLDLGQDAFSKADPTDAEAADIADTVFHEARHAQQWHMIARMLAGEGKSAKAIAAEMGIPADVAADAAGKPLAKGSMEALEAKGWYDGIYGGQAAARNATLNELDAAGTAARRARTAYKKNPTKTNLARLEAAKTRYHAAYERYLALPEEADANRVGAEVTATYLGKDS